MNTQPFTNSKGVISGNCWRIGVLSDSLLRLEWSDTGEFNDDATLMAVNRDFGTPPEYSTSIADGLLTVETTALRLTYDMRPFSKEGLSIVVKGVKDTKTNTWHFGDAQEGNMKGTARTLDWADGAIPLNDGVVSRDGIRAFEDCYPSAAKTMGIPPDSGEPVEFDLTDPRFVRAYFDMHHDLEADGIDFWWIDWQQGGVTRQPGLDPLWVLNHMHYCDSARDGRWPLILSRFAGPGSQRYPVGFSGDTIVTWESLRFQPYFTATASNIGYGWWSHDIGGHMFGYRDEELEARWYQLGVFSPINRLHSSCSPFSGKEPWNFRPEIRAIMDDALRLRHRMIPYLHTMNWRASRTGLPLVEPMYWGSPDIDAAYHVPNEYMFGTELLAAPITEPMDKSSRRGKADVWLPQGDWFDFFTGRRYSASSPNGRRMTVWRPLDGIPVFAKAGGIVPMQPLSEGDSINSVDNPQHLEIIVFPGADGDFTLMEDSGHYSRQITPATTAITYRWRKDGATSALTVSPAQGDVHALPARRTWDFLFRGITDSDISVQADGASVDSDRRYDAETLTLQVTVADVSTRSEIRVTIGDTTMAPDPRMEDVFDILRHAEMRYLTKEQAYAAITENGIDALATMDSLEHVSGPDMEDCSDSHMPSAVRQALTEVLLRS